VKDDPVRGVRVAGLREVVVSTPAAVMQLIAKGEGERHYGTTLMNSRSSRSHTVVQLVIESRRSLAAVAADGGEAAAARASGGAASPRTRKGSNGHGGGAHAKADARAAAAIAEPSQETTQVLHAVVNLVDLAGSERVKRSGATGAALREAGSINKSLLALGTVVAELSKQAAASEHGAEKASTHHIPYRDSKLTRLLQASLGGNAHTAIVATVSPAALSREETRNTLAFATRARNVVNRAVQWVQVTDEASLVVQYQKEIFNLRAQLKAAHEQLRLGSGSGGLATPPPALGIGGGPAVPPALPALLSIGGGGGSSRGGGGNLNRGRIASVMIDPSTVRAMREIGFLHSQRIGEEGEEDEEKEGGGGSSDGFDELEEEGEDGEEEGGEEGADGDAGSSSSSSSSSSSPSPSADALARLRSASLATDTLALLNAAEAALGKVRAELAGERAARCAADERVAELEAEVAGCGVEGARRRMSQSLEDTRLRELLSAAEKRATAAEGRVAGARAEAAQQKSLASQLNRVLQAMQTRETNRSASEQMEAQVQGVLRPQ